MIEISILKNKDNYIGIKTSGHAEFDDYGRDIVCASVSVLVINTINSIDKFCKLDYFLESNEETGEIDFRINENVNDESNLLMKSLVLGLEGIRDSYSEKYLKIFIKEV